MADAGWCAANPQTHNLPAVTSVANAGSRPSLVESLTSRVWQPGAKRYRPARWESAGNHGNSTTWRVGAPNCEIELRVGPAGDLPLRLRGPASASARCLVSTLLSRSGSGADPPAIPLPENAVAL